MKKGILFLAAFIIAVSAGTASAAEKIAFVDTQAVFDKTKLGKKYQDIVKEYYGNRKKILDADAEEIEKLRQDYEKQKSVMNEKARKEKEESIGRKINDFQKKRGDFETEIQKKNDELSKDFDQMLSAILKELAKKDKIVLILNKSISVAPKTDIPSVLYADEGLDLTDKAVAEMDKKSGDKK
jgi:outer membrane protein